MMTRSRTAMPPRMAICVVAVVAQLSGFEQGDMPIRVGLSIAQMGRLSGDRGRYLGSHMEAQLESNEQREAAEMVRVPMQVMTETAAPFDYRSR